MAKKGQASQLQVEINSEEDWEKFLLREGLLVVDVFSEWCGPCTGMSANLKKIKLEIGGDNLHLAMAKSDNVASLERFRDKSEPTWLFIVHRKMVNLMFGPNAPKLQRLIIDELKNLQLDDSARKMIDITELSNEEQERANTVDKVRLESERMEREAKEKAHYEREISTCNNILGQFANNGVIIALPTCRDIVMAVLADLWEPVNLFLNKSERVKPTQDDIDKLRFFANVDDEVAELMVDKLCYAIIIDMPEGFSGDPVDRTLQFVYGNSKQYPGAGDCLVTKIKESIEQHKIEAIAAEKAREAVQAKSLVQVEVKEEEEELKIEEEEERAERGEDNQSEESAIILEGLDSGPAEPPPPEEKEVEKETDWLIWTPHDRNATAYTLRVMFPRITEHYIVHEPPPIPDHIAVAYDAFKRRDIMDIVKDYPDEVMRFGFFTSEDPTTAKLIAKTVPKFEYKSAKEPSQYTEKLIIQLSKKRSDVLLAFAQLGPTFMSPNAVDGKTHCKLFFPEGYDELVEEEEVVEVKKKPAKSKKKKTASATAIESEGMPTEETMAQEEQKEPGLDGEHHDEHALPEGEHAMGEGEEMPKEMVMEEQAHGEEMPREADKATSPEMEPPSDAETEPPPSEPQTVTDSEPATGGDTTDAEA